ncbi:alpha-amylase family glycosyl hydrolase [Microbulbifer pacificus]|uniref:Alpha-amylase family glycosyl hydrolase n=1 Tax=Microbulbifer pacificus TaxID=407164 RepID=A0AAU0MXJ4_9GAMM|nr:alpha-amylase family glycosyl hydrolase [Microbulbifer pacificus]WOX04528.1 alpha-amylase family glycosyl hydrolase [Microbulbifer pacificus]
MKTKLIVTALLLASANASADWHFRGTPNSWSAEALSFVGGTQYKTCQQFSGGDASGGPRFKIDRYANWQEAYPASDYTVAANKNYDITFYSDSKTIQVTEVASCGGDNPAGPDSNFPSLSFRGTPNGWGTSAMELVDDNIWQLQVSLDGQANQRFKLDVYGDWSQNYGDNNSDGVLEQAGSDIYTSATGNYLLTVNDATLGYTLEPVACTENCGSNPQELGALYSPTETTFSLWSPDHANVQLVLDGQNYPMGKVADANGLTDVYSVTVSGDWKLKPYYFVVNGVAVRDPYGRMVEPNTDNNIVMDLDSTDLPGGWSARPSLAEREDAVIYEVHVRDFTIAPESGVSSQKRGKFMGMVESGTTFNGVKTGIDHLKELGVTHVQLMPVYDFNACADPADASCYSWGYDPRNFNVPEERYSLTPDDYENRVREFKSMVDAFHKAGLRVIMDVVYNHTYAKSVFEPISSSYYTPTDLSGTGNSIDANVPMVGRMIRDSLEYWVDEFNIDGFRFDLIGIFDYDEVEDWANHLNGKFPDRNLLIYGEPWNGFAADSRQPYRVRLGTIGRIHESHAGVFNPKFREAIKGQNDNGGCNSGDCFALNSSPDTWRIEVGSRGGIRYTKNKDTAIDTWDPMFAMDPEQSINYVSAHDNLTLRDKILQWADLNGVNRDSSYLRRIQMFANGIVLTSQGIPFLHGGVELMRDKQEDHNSYDSPDAINQYYWQWKIDNADVYAYYRDVIALRRAHPAFRLTSWDEIDQHMTSNRPRYGVVVNHIDGAAVGDSWGEVIVIYNSADNYTYNLPAGEWKVAMEKSDPAAGNGRVVSGTVAAEGTAVTVLYRD